LLRAPVFEDVLAERWMRLELATRQLRNLGRALDDLLESITVRQTEIG
jgi:uncharacterized coiled-coil protein SlyX